jgi:hypothetical protein
LSVGKRPASSKSSDSSQALLPFELAEALCTPEAAAVTHVSTLQRSSPILRPEADQTELATASSGDQRPDPVVHTVEGPRGRAAELVAAPGQFPPDRRIGWRSLGPAVVPTPINAGASATLGDLGSQETVDPNGKRPGARTPKPDAPSESQDRPPGRILNTSSQITTGDVTSGEHPHGRILPSSSRQAEQDAAGSGGPRLTPSALKQLLPVLARLDDRRHAVRDTRPRDGSRVSPSHTQRSAGDRTDAGATGSSEAPNDTNIHEGGQP